MLARIGDVEVWRILENVGPLMPVGKFFPDFRPEMLDRHARAVLPGSLRTDAGDGTLWLVIPVQAFLLRTPRSLVLVDACIGNHKTIPAYPQWSGMTGTRFMASLDAAGARPEDVTHVLCTHLHMDHAGWTTRLADGTWVPTFPNAKVLASASDIETVRAAHDGGNRQMAAYWIWEQTLAPLIEAGRLHPIDMEDEIDPAVRLYPTPGHTQGHVSVEIRAGDARGLVTGDTLHFSLQCALPDLSTIADSDPGLAAQSRRRMLTHLAGTGALAFGTHLPLPSAGRIVPQGEGFLWTPVV